LQGIPENPQCGFSQRVCQILDAYGEWNIGTASIACLHFGIHHMVNPKHVLLCLITCRFCTSLSCALRCFFNYFCPSPGSTETSFFVSTASKAVASYCPISYIAGYGWRWMCPPARSSGCWFRTTPFSRFPCNISCPCGRKRSLKQCRCRVCQQKRVDGSRAARGGKAVLRMADYTTGVC
jgi:hypothetical protein